MSSLICWQPAVDPPDDEMSVLLALADGDVTAGFRLAGEWRCLTAELIQQPVTHWADFPAAPVATESEAPA